MQAVPSFFQSVSVQFKGTRFRDSLVILFAMACERCKSLQFEQARLEREYLNTLAVIKERAGLAELQELNHLKAAAGSR